MHNLYLLSVFLYLSSLSARKKSRAAQDEEYKYQKCLLAKNARGNLSFNLAHNGGTRMGLIKILVFHPRIRRGYRHFYHFKGRAGDASVAAGEGSANAGNRGENYA